MKVGSQIVPDLCASLTDISNSTFVRAFAAAALGALETDSSEAPTALIQGAEDDEPLVRLYSLTSLAGLGPSAQQAVPTIEGALKDTDEFLRAYAVLALQRVQPGRYLDSGAANDESSPRRRLAASLARQEQLAHSMRVVACHVGLVRRAPAT